jgi:hypothetical protein
MKYDNATGMKWVLKMKEFAEKDVKKLAEMIHKAIRNKPLRFYDVLKIFKNEEYRKILLAWARIFQQRKIIQDQFGKWRTTSEKKGASSHTKTIKHDLRDS